MTSRGRTTFVFALFGAVVSFFTVVAVILIVVGRHSDAVLEADSAAKHFEVARAAHSDKTTRALAAVRGETDFAQVLQAVDRQLSAAPKLERLDGYGPDNSAAYKKAAESRPSHELWSLRDTLERAVAQQSYVVEARKALLDPQAFFPKGEVTNGDPFRTLTIPRLKSLQAAYEQVSVPADAEKADDRVRAVFDLMLSESDILASKADDQISYGFDPAETYDAAKAAVNVVEKNAEARVAAALKDVIG